MLTHIALTNTCGPALPAGEWSLEVQRPLPGQRNLFALTAQAAGGCWAAAVIPSPGGISSSESSSSIIPWRCCTRWWHCVTLLSRLSMEPLHKLVPPGHRDVSRFSGLLPVASNPAVGVVGLPGSAGFSVPSKCHQLPALLDHPPCISLSSC